MTASTEELFDVVIYEIATGRVGVLAGERLRRNTGFYNAEKRLETVLMHGNLNDRYTARIVPAGVFAKGDVLP
jgi:hypothetical protein